MARFILDGRVEVYWLTSLPSDPNAPTQAEITAGDDLVGSAQAEELVDIQGFEVETSSIPTPGYAGTLVGNVAGEQTYPDSVLSFYKDTADSTLYDLFTSGTQGWVFIAMDGLGTGEEGLLFPATVASRVRRPARNAPHIFDVNFAIDVPYECTQAA